MELAALSAMLLHKFCLSSMTDLLTTNFWKSDILLEGYLTFKDQRSSRKLRLLSLYIKNEWQSEVSSLAYKSVLLQSLSLIYHLFKVKNDLQCVSNKNLKKLFRYQIISNDVCTWYQIKAERFFLLIHLILYNLLL